MNVITVIGAGQEWVCTTPNGTRVVLTPTADADVALELGSDLARSNFTLNFAERVDGRERAV